MISIILTYNNYISTTTYINIHITFKDTVWTTLINTASLTRETVVVDETEVHDLNYYVKLLLYQKTPLFLGHSASTYTHSLISRHKAL